MVHLVSVVRSCFVVLSLVPVLLTQIQEFPNSDIFTIPSRQNLGNPQATVAASPTVHQRGLCRDGWSRGSIIDVSGEEIPVCMRLNPQAQTWSEAQDTCRKDYGFLLKLDSPAKINNVNLVSYLSEQGIRRFWTGLHTYAEHLVWDDLIPNSVRPNNPSNDSSFPTRPWTWSNNPFPDTSELCGYLNILDDDKKRRRKRAPDEDSPDIFDLATLQDRLYQFQRPTSKYLPTAAFQTMLSRTQFSDQLPELPGTSLGIQSEQQLPGAGLSDTNLQTGSLFTDLAPFDPSTKPPDNEDKETSNSDNTGTTNIMQSDFFSQNAQNSQSDLLGSVREVAAKLSDKLTKPQETSVDGSKDNGMFNMDSEKIAEKGVLGSVVETLTDTTDPSSDNLKPSDDKTVLEALNNVLEVPVANTIIESITTKSNEASTQQQTTTASQPLTNEASSGVLSDMIDPSTIDDLNEKLSGKDIITDDNSQPFNINENIQNNVEAIATKDSNIIPMTESDIGESIKDIVENIDSVTNNNGLFSVGLPENEKVIETPESNNKPILLTQDELLNTTHILPEVPSVTDDTTDDMEIFDKELPKIDDTPINTDEISKVISTNDDNKQLGGIQDGFNIFASDDTKHEQGSVLDEFADELKDNLLDESTPIQSNILTDFDTMLSAQDDLKSDDMTVNVPSLEDVRKVNTNGDDENDNTKFEIPDKVYSENNTVGDMAELFRDFMDEVGKGIPEVTQNEIEAAFEPNANDDQEILPKQTDDLPHFDDINEIKPSEFVTGTSTIEKLDDVLESIKENIGKEPSSQFDDAHDSAFDGMSSNHSNDEPFEDAELTRDIENDIHDTISHTESQADVFDKINDVADKLDDKIDSFTELSNDRHNADDLNEIHSELPGEIETPSDFRNEHEIDNLPDEMVTNEYEGPLQTLAGVIDDNNEMKDIDEINEIHEIADTNDDIVSEKDDVTDIDRHGFDELDVNRQSDIEHGVELPEPDDLLDNVQERPDLAEDIERSDQKTLIAIPKENQRMDLSTCNVRLPSICFSYEVEVMTTASTCEQGWYGHVLLDSCYKILDGKFTYSRAATTCKALGARVSLGESKFERNFILMSVQKEGHLHRGEKVWMETTAKTTGCKYFDESGISLRVDCETWLNVVCVKDAKSLSVHLADTSPYYNEGGLVDVSSMDAELKLFSSRVNSNGLICELTSAASEFPVLWFKDGILVETKDKYITPDISLHLNASLIEAFRRVTSRDITLAGLQGKYWCEVWDRKSLTRKRSRPYDVRFSDVITFHGSIQLRGVRAQAGTLFNMMNEQFPALSAVQADLKTVFSDTLGPLRAAFPHVVDVYTFIDRVRSSPSVVEYHTYYSLQRDYTDTEEDQVYSRVKAVLKSRLANPRYMASLPGRTPVMTFRTMSLQSTVSCPVAYLQTNVDVNGRKVPAKQFQFPKAQLGEFANSVDNCSSTNRYPAGTARCLGDFNTGAYWGSVVANECLDESAIDRLNTEIWGSSPFTDKLSEIAKTVVKADNVDKVVSQVAHIADVAARLTPTDINKIADVLDHSTQVGKLSEKVGKKVLKTIDKLMSTSQKEVHVANVETKAANRIIKSLERYAERADLGKKGNVRMVSDNVVVELWDLKPNSDQVIGLAAETKVKSLGNPFKDEVIATVFNKSQLDNANVDAAIELPKEVFSRKEKGVSLGNRLTMMVFRKSRLFQAAISSDGKVLKPTEQQLNNLNSYVISASIAGKKLKDLKESVRTIFRPLKDRDGTRSCVWWDFDMNDRRGGWSSAGCYYDGKINGRDICLCDHLTNFAVLLDFYGQAEPIPDHHELSLSIITVLGLACSILGLSLTIISYLFFKKLRKGRAQQTLFNLSLALLFSMLVFLVGIKQTHSYVGCLVVAILLHYFILVSFMWMLMEAILQYLTFVKILGTYITRFTMKTVLPAWGLPLIPVIAVLSVDYHLYHGGPNYCWMDLPAFYFAFVIPITSIIVINIIIFLVTIVSIFRRGKGLRSNQKKQKMAMTNLQAAITSFILLGLTWVFGYLAIADARLPFQYVFTIMNSLQGFFIFILFVVRKKKVRDQWYIVCCRGGEKDRVSRSLSASNSIPSSYSNGSNRNSKHERDRSDSTKTTQSTYSNSSGGFTNYGYDHGYDTPYARHGRRFRKF